MYTDNEVLHLPEISADHIHAKEWQIRKHSCKRLTKYLKDKAGIKILEVGCGNGWLSHQLSKLPGSHVTGIDINELELNQAKRVFSEQSNLSFIYGDLHLLINSKLYFDIVVFAASIQYFKFLDEAIKLAFELLRPRGELHIIDSPFYTRKELSGACSRTKQYFSTIGFPGMEDYYFHHSIESLKGFDHAFLHNPHSFKIKLLGNKSPFFWIRLIK